MAALNAISATQLLRLIGTCDGPIVVDVRTDEDFGLNPFVIPGAIRHPHGDPGGLATRLDGRGSVIVCHKGLKLSQGVAAWLRHDGLDSEYLEGGILGWLDDPLTPRIPARTHPALPCGPSLWVTRHRPKIDRIACPWLIRRFVDPRARFLFVAPDEVAGVADRFDATPFDVHGAFWGHRDDGCTFDTMLDEWGLRSAALDRLARVVRAADTGRHDMAPEAAGLLAVSVGLSRQFRDDTDQLDAGMTLYDALFRWARDAHDETHKSDLDEARQ